MLPKSFSYALNVQDSNPSKIIFRKWFMGFTSESNFSVVSPSGRPRRQFSVVSQATAFPQLQSSLQDGKGSLCISVGRHVCIWVPIRALSCGWTHKLMETPCGLLLHTLQCLLLNSRSFFLTRGKQIPAEFSQH